MTKSLSVKVIPKMSFRFAVTKPAKSREMLRKMDRVETFAGIIYIIILLILL
jgi:hypothetical protein